MLDEEVLLHKLQIEPSQALEPESHEELQANSINFDVLNLVPDTDSSYVFDSEKQKMIMERKAVNPEIFSQDFLLPTVLNEKSITHPMQQQHLFTPEFALQDLNEELKLTESNSFQSLVLSSDRNEAELLPDLHEFISAIEISEIDQQALTVNAHSVPQHSVIERHGAS